MYISLLLVFPKLYSTLRIVFPFSFKILKYLLGTKHFIIYKLCMLKKKQLLYPYFCFFVFKLYLLIYVFKYH